MRLVLTLLALGLAVCPPVRANRAAEIARIHVAAIGGLERIRALTSLRMIGQVHVRDERVAFTLVAARPNRVRLETLFDFRRVIQATDGIAPPWEIDPARSPRAVAMAPAAAELFLLDTEFDDPLVRGLERPASLEFAGEKEMHGRRFLRILVSRSLTEAFHVLLDPETYLIRYRVHELTRGGSTTEVVTRHQEFRPVDGVLLAHEVTLFLDGKLSQRMAITRIDANPRVTPEMFAPPVAIEPARR